MEKIKFIDLFSGIGGFRIALEKLNCECVFSCDVDKWANETYFKNFGEYPSGDIRLIEANEIPDHDILCAGFPCQSFSIAGYRKGFNDNRGNLFFQIIRILQFKKPAAFILENVKGITSHDKGNTINKIRELLKKSNYAIFEKVMNAINYNLPQNRERWFCVGFRKDLSIKYFHFPKSIKLKKKVWDLLENNVKAHGISKIALGHIDKHLKEKQLYGKSRITIVNEVRPSRCSVRCDGISPCLVAKMGTGGNNVPIIVEEKRKFTVRECLRLMGFPESFIIRENNYQSYKQIGNSVAIPIIEMIAKNIIKILRS